VEVNVQEQLDLAGRVAVVTGATRNIGFATAELFARQGASLVINALSEDALDDTAEHLRSIGDGKVVAAAGDICDAATTTRIIEAALDVLGGADIIVNNALIDGGRDGFTLLEAPRSAWDRQFEGYIHAPLRLAAALAPTMAAGGHGSIVNVISGAALTPLSGMATYGVTKAAMWAMTRHLAKELAPDIRVNALCPGTTSATGELELEAMKPLVARVPLQRLGTAAETARAALFLASDASSYTTAQLLFADGGRSELISPG
jgi:NAD(P)-dependent dehydrogenase (short-subunit alcohol dehydrogenase family)